MLSLPFHRSAFDHEDAVMSAKNRLPTIRMRRRLLPERDHGRVFDADGESKMGMLSFERIFPYGASMLHRSYDRFPTPFFVMLGAEER